MLYFFSIAKLSKTTHGKEKIQKKETGKHNFSNARLIQKQNLTSQSDIVGNAESYVPFTLVRLKQSYVNTLF